MNEIAEDHVFVSSDEAESAFYSAFEKGDMNLMQAVLTDQNVSCTHPNSMPIVGRKEVLNSWDILLKTITDAVFQPEVLHRTVEGENVGNIAIHLVAEKVIFDNKVNTNPVLLIVTNIYVKQSDGWKMLMLHCLLLTTINHLRMILYPHFLLHK